jgi:hypothetical protein
MKVRSVSLGLIVIGLLACEYKTGLLGGYFDEKFGTPAKRPNRAGVSPREPIPRPRPQ